MKLEQDIKTKMDKIDGEFKKIRLEIPDEHIDEYNRYVSRYYEVKNIDVLISDMKRLDKKINPSKSKIYSDLYGYIREMNAIENRLKHVRFIKRLIKNKANIKNNSDKLRVDSLLYFIDQDDYKRSMLEVRDIKFNHRMLEEIMRCSAKGNIIRGIFYYVGGIRIVARLTYFNHEKLDKDLIPEPIVNTQMKDKFNCRSGIKSVIWVEDVPDEVKSWADKYVYDGFV